VLGPAGAAQAARLGGAREALARGLVSRRRAVPPLGSGLGSPRLWWPDLEWRPVLRLPRPASGQGKPGAGGEHVTKPVAGLCCGAAQRTRELRRQPAASQGGERWEVFLGDGAWGGELGQQLEQCFGDAVPDVPGCHPPYRLSWSV